ncbi:MAG: hypothetical protein KF777_24345, partial [Planctomycetaceae bacterium]|nr:hypothetical protein [Planctomycetaceae bacterium]
DSSSTVACSRSTGVSETAAEATLCRMSAKSGGDPRIQPCEHAPQKRCHGRLLVNATLDAGCKPVAHAQQQTICRIRYANCFHR